MSATISMPCPRCGNTGPHTVTDDQPDADLAHRMAMLCANSDTCGIEFTYDSSAAGPAAGTLDATTLPLPDDYVTQAPDAPDGQPDDPAQPQPVDAT